MDPNVRFVTASQCPLLAHFGPADSGQGISFGDVGQLFNPLFGSF